MRGVSAKHQKAAIQIVLQFLNLDARVLGLTARHCVGLDCVVLVVPADLREAQVDENPGYADKPKGHTKRVGRCVYVTIGSTPSTGLRLLVQSRTTEGSLL